MTPPAHILVIEDDPPSREMLIRRLSSRGFRVEGLGDGESCLRRFEENTDLPDLLLLDINMPGISGLEVLARLRERFSHDALPVILVTALADSEDVVRGLQAGANDYVAKPIQFTVLLARVNTCLQLKRGVQLLVEAERQRALIQALGEACHQLAQPMTAITMTLEDLARHPPVDPKEASEQLTEVLRWIGEVGEVIHRMQKVGTQQKSLSFTDRMDLLDEGSPASGRESIRARQQRKP